MHVAPKWKHTHSDYPRAPLNTNPWKNPFERDSKPLGPQNRQAVCPVWLVFLKFLHCQIYEREWEIIHLEKRCWNRFITRRKNEEDFVHSLENVIFVPIVLQIGQEGWFCTMILFARSGKSSLLLNLQHDGDKTPDSVCDPNVPGIESRLGTRGSWPVALFVVEAI